MSSMDIGDRNPCVDGSMYEPRRFTNADRIRGMSDVELLQFIAAVFCSGMVAEERGNDFNHSFVWTLDWLRQPAEEENP